MYKTKLLVALLVCIAIMFTGCPKKSKTVVKKLKTSKELNQSRINTPKRARHETDKIDGVLYQLPLTVMESAIPITRTKKTKGKFLQFAPCFFSESEASNATTSTTIGFTVAKPTLTTRGEPDTSQTYIINTKGSFFESKTLFVEYSPGYVLSKGEAESKDNTVEFVTKAVGTAVGIGTKFAGVANRQDLTINKEDSQQYLDERAGEFRLEQKCYRKIIEYRVRKLLKNNTDIKELLKDKKESANINKVITHVSQIISELAHTNYRSSGSFSIKHDFTNSPKEIQNLAKQNRTYVDSNNITKKISLETIITNNPYNNEDDLEQAYALTNGYISSLYSSANNSDKTQPASQDEGLDLRDEYNLAKETHQQLIDVQNQRNNLLSNFKEINAESLNILLKENKDTITALKGAFLGNTAKKIWNLSIECKPTKATKTDLCLRDNTVDAETNEFIPQDSNATLVPYQKEELFFSYSATSGVCNNGLINEQNIKIPKDFAFKKCNATEEKKINSLWPNVGILQDQFQYLRRVGFGAIKAEKDDKSRGWFYRVPAKTEATFWQAEVACENAKAPFDCTKANSTLDVKVSDKITNVSFMVAQLGVVTSVPAKTAGMSSSTTIALDPKTGAMLNFKVSTDALLDKSILEEAEKSANSIIDSADGIKKKERELKLLELQNQINEEREALENPDPEEEDPR